MASILSIHFFLQSRFFRSSHTIFVKLTRQEGLKLLSVAFFDGHLHQFAAAGFILDVLVSDLDRRRRGLQESSQAGWMLLESQTHNGIHRG
jgi:hypothetical protein